MSIGGVGKSSGGGSVRKTSSSKSSSSSKKASSSKPTASTKKPAQATNDKVKVSKPESAAAAKQSNQLVNNLGSNFAAKKPGEQTQQQKEREQELFNRLGDRVTPGKNGNEGSFMQGAGKVEEMTQELFKPEAAAGRDGSAVQDRFNKYMEDNHRDPRMDAKISGKDHNLLDMTLSNPAANLRETVMGGFTK